MMRLYVFPYSPRALKVIALRNYLGLECEQRFVDLGHDAHLDAEFKKLNPNQKMPVLEDDGFVLWESNAILQYLAAQKPESGLWPDDLKGRANVLRWLLWESAHWDQQAWGLVGFEKGSKIVLRLGPPDLVQIARGEQAFHRFAAVLDEHLKGRAWIVGHQVTIADFAIGAWLPMAQPFNLPVGGYEEIMRWYDGMASLRGWQESIVRPPLRS